MLFHPIPLAHHIPHWQVSPIEATIFGDWGSDLDSGGTVTGDPAGARGKPGESKWRHCSRFGSIRRCIYLPPNSHVYVHVATAHSAYLQFPPHASGSLLPCAGSGYGYGAGVRIDTPIGPLRLEYAMNDRQQASGCMQAEGARQPQHFWEAQGRV